VDPNATRKEPEKKTSSIARSKQRNKISEQEKSTTRGRKGGTSGQAFKTSTQEAKVHRSRPNAGKMQQRSTAEKCNVPKAKKPIVTKSNQMTNSNDIFGGKSKSSGSSRNTNKNVTHMESSFTFG